jgi:3-hydroxyacyl-CoA dehydrogenase
MYRIQQVAVLGSGIMGSRIACHFANAGFQVILLDIPPSTCTPEETARGLDTSSPPVRNRLVNDALRAAIASKPSPLFRQAYSKRIQTGNFDDDLHRIQGCDWIIEAVVERLDIKQQLFERVEQYRKPGTPVTSNTSGIPIALMTKGRSADFRRHFCGAHFFNPPRYLRLLELIQLPKRVWRPAPWQNHRTVQGYARIHRQPHRCFWHSVDFSPRSQRSLFD